MSHVSWPRICFAGPPVAAVSFLRDHAVFPLSLQDKKRFHNEEELAAVWRLLFCHLSVWCLRGHFMLLLYILDSMQIYLQGVGLFVDLLDVASVSQGLMLSGYLRLEYLVANVNS